ncbi:phosphotransferase enzyme family protein [Cordyceps fumosorosea ARSEF 2679]|uniref:Phosphotransferase enzyme family protein n=1 Tax=Cordyceps fumosorosea (strain ARSEF 2679) TaxID=1081104 RepID=A0A167TKP3_CORFA|nr:phosphotransferase enzyme family protein [Cordyceps fumosorosea ARSEF 2679]OAA60700.1 phosphotransferase enzyme family protein [Cordyceps fumosorosea ARSEF 2679]
MGQRLYLGLVHLLRLVWDLSKPLLLRLWPRLSRGDAAAPDVELASNKNNNNNNAAPEPLPLPREAAHATADSFIDALQYERVANLASRYNGGTPCHVLYHLCGSFNACFFVEFAECRTRWTVRVPIEPSLHKPWEKLQSEVATLNYIRAHTTIPVPVVHAFGRDAVLTNNESQCQIFLISSMIPGRPLTDPVMEILYQADDATKKQFFLQLIDYLAQLRGLTFPKPGSLMLTTSEEPLLGAPLSIIADEHRSELPSMTTATEYMRAQHQLLTQDVATPEPKFSEDDYRYELFALHTMREQFDQFIQEPLEAGPFILHHPDMQPCNIIVDDDLKIQGIIDWEFTHTVPLQLFTPPLWTPARRDCA